MYHFVENMLGTYSCQYLPRAYANNTMTCRDLSRVAIDNCGEMLKTIKPCGISSRWAQKNCTKKREREDRDDRKNRRSRKRML